MGPNRTRPSLRSSGRVWALPGRWPTSTPTRAMRGAAPYYGDDRMEIVTDADGRHNAIVIYRMAGRRLHVQAHTPHASRCIVLLRASGQCALRASARAHPMCIGMHVRVACVQGMAALHAPGCVSGLQARRAHGAECLPRLASASGPWHWPPLQFLRRDQRCSRHVRPPRPPMYIDRLAQGSGNTTAVQQQHGDCCGPWQTISEGPWHGCTGVGGCRGGGGAVGTYKIRRPRSFASGST